MTTNLRIVSVTINNSTNIDVTFTETLTRNLVTANATIISQTNNIPSSQVLQVTVNNDTLSIVCRPLTPYAAYYLQFQSTVNNPFISTNGDAKISEDGVSNKTLITGPLPSDNPVNDYLQSFYQNNIYRASDTTTVINKYLQSVSVNFARALYDIRQSKNENYLSFTIIDELHTRGEGPFERLYEESVYDIFRVGLVPTQTLVNTSFVFSEFPSYPVTLQRQIATEILKPSSDNTPGTFNINTFIINLSNNPITKVNSIVFTLTTSNPIFNYDITRLGYQLLDSKYDQDFSSTYLLLDDNQVKINEAILTDPNFSLDQIFSITIQYEYKSLGTTISSDSINLFTTLQSSRETLPPIIKIFNLQHAPITDANNDVPLVGGVTFIDLNSNGTLPHPAFLNEIPFSLSSPPSSPGVYSIDYSTGTVYVYGENSNNDGTGPSPPIAFYNYRLTYTSEIDYVYDADASDIIALPLGNLINSTGTVNFNYEQVLVPGIDYVADSHIEAIDERVKNKLISLNTLVTQNSPITNVFRILNETSGEIYLLDRWDNNHVYFKYNKPPRILQQIGESATFTTINNELLTANTTITNSNSLRIFVINLANNDIVNSTQDGIATSFNSSLIFVDGAIFVTELWYNQEFDASTNINRLKKIGQYTVDYKNGIVYLAVSNNQNNDLGTVSYKISIISPIFPHIISVDDIYYRISVLNPKNKQFHYTIFSDGSINISDLDVSDEGFINGTVTSPYQLLRGEVGAFIDATFVPGVTNAVKFIRSIYEYNDLLNSTNPINFASVSTSNNFNINVGSINRQSFETIQYDGTNYFITLNENIPYLSSGITYTFNVVRVSDSQVLWNSLGTVVPGNPLKLILPGIGTPHIGDLVNVIYSFTIVPLQRVIIDYNKGNFYTDYTYLADEILVSYEYGDNVIDFRKNTNLAAGSNYYVSYKAGALRDALLKNFGTLVNVPNLSTFDLSLNRERYREALQAALSSFIQGPTIGAIKNIVQIITHIEPEVIESAFEVWSLGNNLLFPIGVETTGDFQLLPAHFGNGVLINNSNQNITLPINSNLRLEEGTFETWIFPQWNGLDNDANLIFKITRDGYTIDPYRVFIGGGEYHPVINAEGSFTLNKLSKVLDRPNTNKDGVFIYYTKDVSGDFFRWYIEVIDGYVFNARHTYKFQILSDGNFYDVKPISLIKPSNMSTFTGTNKLNLTITPRNDGYDGYSIDEGITFVSDVEHYILDLGVKKDANRLSIYKDISGYLNFRVFDKNHRIYMVSADVSSWQANIPHMISASWKLNTRNNRDEMHLFVDGLEVPNIIKYGQKLQPYLHEKFRTVDPEEIIGLSARDIIGSNDLNTTAGSPVVTSSINFSQFNIFAGDTIFINEVGFSPTGYTILNINGQSLSLSAPAPSTISGGVFSINQTQYLVNSDINISPNITVSTIHTFTTGNDLATQLNYSIVTSTNTNFSQKGVRPGFLLRIDNPAFSLTYTILQVNGNSLTITDPAPISLSNISFQVYSNVENEISGVRAINPSYKISQDQNFNNILTISNNVFANDLILIKTLGLNFRDVKKQYYVWGSNQENILKTQLPPPIDLNEVDITKIILPSTIVPTSNLTFSTAQPSNSQIGRTIQATISGTNVNFSSPVQITINGVSGGFTISETINFTKYETLSFSNLYTSINSINVIATPINSSKNILAIDVREKYSITHSESNEIVPIVRYSYRITGGYNLSGNGTDNTVTDTTNLFSALDIGSYLFISSPASAAGYYIIIGLSADRHSINIQSTTASFSVPLPSFSGGVYQVLNTTSYRSGLQNGFFTLEINNRPGQPYLLNQGFYEIEYSTYASIKFDPLNGKMYIGSDFNGSNHINSILDQSTIYSIMLTDTRIGETVANNKKSITKDFNSLRAPKPDINTLVSISFDSFPFSNNAKFYANINNENQHFQSNLAVNDNFYQSVVILDKPILLSNAGILDTKKEGTIEFWMSPLFDTANDPNTRYYFDAYVAVREEVISTSNVTVKVSSPASQILSVNLASGDQKTDYFAGGKLEIDSVNAIQEDTISIGNIKAIVSEPILQVITVKIIGDPTNTDYFNGGAIGTDQKTIFFGTLLPQSNLPLIITYKSSINSNTINSQVIRLSKKLPAQNSKIIVTYVPSGLRGDRISIFKDIYGYINFNIHASGADHTVRAPTRWVRGTWHRVKASYKVNGNMGNDEMRLFLDGYHYTNVLFGQGVVFGSNPTGLVSVGDGYGLVSNIVLKDSINELYIGTDYQQSNPIFTLLDNFRISNISRAIYAPFGEPIDVNFNNNMSTVFPVVKDLYTTFLMDFNKLNVLIDNFSNLIDRTTGAFDFTVNIFDSFGIVSSSVKVKEVLENLISILKPANSRAFIKYTK